MMKTNFNPKKIRMIIGLGNPGEEYADTYHNIGRQFVLQTAGNGIKFKTEQKQKFSHTNFNAREWVFPDTYMNESGGAIGAALKWFGVSPEEFLLVHDDSDLPAGTIRIEFGRGAAGHNGVLSAIHTLGTEDFWRARIGIRTDVEGAPREKAEDFVLRKISPAVREKIETVFTELAERLN